MMDTVFIERKSAWPGNFSKKQVLQHTDCTRSAAECSRHEPEVTRLPLHPRQGIRISITYRMEVL